MSSDDKPLAVAPQTPQPPASQASSVTVTPTAATAAASGSGAGAAADRDVEKQQPQEDAPAAAAPAAAAAAPAPAPARAPAAAPAAGVHVPHWKLVFDQPGVTPEVLAHQYPGEGTEESPYVVSFLHFDPHDPQQYPYWKKWMITIIMAIATLGIAFVSTAYTGGLREIIATFHISAELSIAGISLFVLGFAIGPLIWAPSSEFFGRWILFVLTYTALTLFNVGAACAQNIQTLLIMRFFAGAFGSSPLTNAGGVIADMFPASQRGLATAVFAAAPFLGPALGPIVAGFLGDAAGWRWVEGLMAIFTGVMVIIGGLLVPETYAPLLLRKRAAALSAKTGHVYVSRLDMHHRNPATGSRGPSMATQFRTALSRPWILLFREPIVFIISLYMAIVYGTMYMMFAAFPIIFEETRGWSAGIGGLAFLGLAVGMMLAVTYAMFDNKTYNKKAAASPDGVAPPEARLPSAMIGSVLLPIGLFWFAWTNLAPVHWIVPIIGSAFFAAGLVLVFLSLMNYLIDSYVIFAASVLAANAVIRSLFGAAFPLFTTYMYQNLGIHWASSIPAFLALACVPFPFLFMRYGKTIRMRCKFAAEAAEVMARMRAHAKQQQQQHEQEQKDVQKQQAAADETDGADDADFIDETQAITEIRTRESQRKMERKLQRQATKTDGVAVQQHGDGAVVASGSRTASDDGRLSSEKK